MSAEWVTAAAAVGTLIVIAATALAAIVQLKHIRAANQLAGLMSFSSSFESDQMQSAINFISHELPQRLKEPAFISGLLETNPDRREHPELRMCDFLEQQGSYIKYGMIDQKQYIDLVGGVVTSMWDELKEVLAVRRAARNDSRMYENFEYLASLAERVRRPQKLPRGVPALMPEPTWREVARQTIAAAQANSQESGGA